MPNVAVKDLPINCYMAMRIATTETLTDLTSEKRLLSFLAKISKSMLQCMFSKTDLSSSLGFKL